MIKEYYRFEVKPNRLAYQFYSIGPKGTIEKIVVFEQENENDRYSIGFGDVVGGRIDTTIISNNQDLLKIISTIAFIIQIFFDYYPSSTLEIEAIDTKRLQLYNTIFKRRFTEIEQDFFVDDYRNGKFEVYSPQYYYEKFEIRLKHF